MTEAASVRRPRPYPFVYNGRRFTSQMELANYLARQLGCTAVAAARALARRGDDPHAVEEFYRRHPPGPQRDPRPTKQIEYQGVTYSRAALSRVLSTELQHAPGAIRAALAARGDDAEAVKERYRQISRGGNKERNRAATARQIAPQCGGRKPRTIEHLLAEYGDDAEAVIRYCQRHPSRPTIVKCIVYEGREYNRKALAGLLALQWGRSVSQVETLLRKNNDNVAAVLQVNRDARPSTEIAVGGKVYPDLTALVRELRRRYRVVAASTLYRWIRAVGVEQTIARVKAHAAKERARRAREPKLDRTVAVFGWRWSSFTAMRRYYRFAARRHIVADWEDHLVTGRSGALFPPLARALSRLWEVGELDERNRLSAARETWLPRSCLPLNGEPEDVADPMERSMIDALQPPEVMTVRRACLRDLDRMRQLVGAR